MIKEDLKRQTTSLSGHCQVYVNVWKKFCFPVLQDIVATTNRMVPISPAPNFGLLSLVALSEKDGRSFN